MKKSKLFYSLGTMIFLVLSFNAFAQQRTITGMVQDAKDNSPLDGATVTLKKSNVSTVTNSTGKFEIRVPNGKAELEVSYVGHDSRTVTVGSNQTNVVVALVESAKAQLSDVVVVGYGTQKKENLTGSVSSVSGEEIAKKPVMRASAALEGLASGVTVTQSSGQPGADGGSIRIRGIGTLGNANPLVLIDGIEGVLDGVDPNDIQNISILKDAAAAAIYGSRAANGVILVTTKSGNSGDPKVTYNAYSGWQRFTDLPDYVNGYTYMTTLNQAYRNEGRDPLYSEDYLKAYQENKATDPDHYPDVDWQKTVYTGSGFLQNHYVGVSGGGKRFKIMGSVAYQDQKGEVPMYESERYSFRLNTQMDITKNFQLRLNLAGRHSPTLSPAGGTGTYGVISEVIRTAPIYPAVLSDGRYGVGLSGTNPLARVQDGGYDRNTYESFLGTFQANYQPFKGADIELNFTPQFNDNRGKSFFKAVSTYDPDVTSPAFTFPSKTTLTEDDLRSWENTLHLLLRYSKAFNGNNFHFLGGYEQIAYTNDSLSAFRDSYALPEYQELNSGSVENWQNGGTGYEWALRSYFGRLNYDYMGKYLFEANLRVDGSSRFAAGNKFGTFPSFSVGWRVSEENFLKNVQWLSDLKLRASWGQLGNQEIGNYPFASVINLGVNYILGGTPAIGAAQTDMANRNISWESTTSKNLGIDIGLMQNKLNITYEYYIRNTSGILLQLPIPAIIGLSKPYQNAGEVKNTGWDLSVNYGEHSKAFKYNIGFNLSDVKNEVVDLKGTGPYISSYSFIAEGYPINTLYGYKSLGLFQDQTQIDKSPKQFGNYAPGDIIYKDINGDGVINADDRVPMGNQIPRYTFGLTFSAEYKNFDLSLLVQGVGKEDIFLNGDAVWAFYNAGVIRKWQLDYWTPDNPNAKYPRLISQTTHNNFQTSSFWVYNSAFARLKNLQIGYELPKQLLARTFINKLRFYVSGQNLFTLDSMPQGWDPERNSGGGAVYPITSTYVFGLNLTF